MSLSVTIKDKNFNKFIDFQQISESVREIAHQINHDLNGKKPIFLAVLNGSFMFAAELMKEITINCEITFIRLASYEGTISSNSVKQILGLNENIADRTVVILEDIVDSGKTIVTLLEELNKHQPKEIKIATLLFKPQALKEDIHLDYVALEIPNDFIVGYGLDYDGYGRNLKHIYKINE